MARVIVYADESGNLDFSRGSGASKYFILTTVTVGDGLALMADLRHLRYELPWESNVGERARGSFHATKDPGPLRARVFDILARHDLRIDATILEKTKALPKYRESEELFYQLAWYYHLKHLAPRVCRAADELLVVAASFGVRKKRAAFHRAVRHVVEQVAPTLTNRTVCWDAAEDHCLQAADYCSWALQRKWEQGDLRAYNQIQERVRSEFDLWERGRNHYY